MRRDDEQNRNNKMHSVSKTALAFGAGAVFLYRNGGNKFLSKQLPKALKGLDAGKNILDKSSYLTTRGHGKEFLKKTRGEIEKAYRSVDKLGIRTNSRNSFFSVIQESQNLSQNKTKLARNMHYQEKVIGDLKAEFSNNPLLKNIETSRLNNLADDAVTHLTQTIAYEDKTKDIIKFTKSFDSKVNHLVGIKKDSNPTQEALKQAETIKEIVKDKLLKREATESFVKEREAMIDKVIDKLTDFEEAKRNFGTRNEPKKGTEFIDAILGDQAATVKEILAHRDEFANSKLPNVQDTYFDRLQELVEKDKRFEDLVVDQAIRIKDDQITSNAKAAEMFDKLQEKVLHTTPGKLTKPLEQKVYEKQMPITDYVARGSTDYFLPKVAENKKSNIMDHSYIRILDRSYRINGSDLEHVEALDDYTKISGEHGSYVRLLKNMTGDVDRIEPTSPIKKFFGIGTSPKDNVFKEKIDKAKVMARKAGINVNVDSEKYLPNLFERLRDSVESIDNLQDAQERTDAISEFLQDFRMLNQSYKKTTSALDPRSASDVAKHLSNQPAREIMELSSMSKQDILEQLQNDSYLRSGLFGDNVIRNADLKSLLSKLQSSPSRAEYMKSINSIKKDGFKVTQVEDVGDLVRRELQKEALLREGGQWSDFDSDHVLSVIQNAALNKDQSDEAKRLLQWTVLQEKSSIFSSSAEVIEQGRLEQTYKEVKNYFTRDYRHNAKESNFTDDFKNTAEELINSRLPDDIPASEEELNDIIKANRSNKSIYIKKGINVTDLVKNINDEEMRRAYFKQFTAGRNNMEDVTTATLLPYFSVFRLSDALAGTGLNLSPDDTGSTFDMMKNIALKRVLPAMALMSAWSYLNYESENFTGTSIEGAAANSVAKFSLGARSIADTFGLDKYFKSAWYTNPYAQYLFETPYRDSEEQAEWYREGYTPVRKGRWWSFGSSSEFRGGKIDYWQPNYVRRANTAWEDIGTYGSSEEKWKHSLIPTLRHPFSPIRYLANPYWLEEKNKYSRPYPLTGKLFGEGMPFAGVLNATIGNLIKPQRNIHENLTANNFMDVRDLIAQQNDYIKYKATRQEQQTYRLGGNAQLTESSSGEGIYVPPVLRAAQGTMFEEGETGFDVPSFNSGKPQKVTLMDKLFVSTSNTLTNAKIALDHIAQINQETKQRINKTGYVKSVDALSAVDTLDLLNDQDFVSDLKAMKGVKENLLDVAYSAKQISGIYGFIFDEVVGTKQRYALAAAHSMDSFSRRFWDDSVGGTGGELMEIARRFFPHENHDIERINPIRNNMPDWMPDRFKHGDPYTQVKKGEMRMPGAAYEAINHLDVQPDFSLHPYMLNASSQELYEYFLNKSEMDEHLNALPQVAIDLSQQQIENTLKRVEHVRKRITKDLERGIINKGVFYSDFDKFKILADVAPWSQEYKDMRTKMRRYGDQEAVQEILDRVEKQNRGHQFFNYQYRGVSLKSDSVVIDEIQNNGFTIVGSDKVFQLAGVETDAETLSEKLRSGMRVKIQYEEADGQQDTVKVIVNSGSTNINRELFKEDAKVQNESAIDTLALATPMQKAFGMAFETIGHLPIPYIHNKFMKMETPLEAYKNENVYGTPFSTWSHPIKSMLMPSMQKGWGVSGTHAALGIAAWGASEFFNATTNPKFHNKLLKRSADIAFGLITPGAFTGAVASFIPTLGKEYIRTASRIGATAWAVGYGYHHANNPLIATTLGSAVGALAGDWYDGLGKEGALIGATAGLLLSAYKTKGFKLDEINKPYIPESTQKRWEIEEYYDRLNYVKYKGLFEKAARLAKKEEGVDIKQVLKDLEKEEARLEKQKEKALKTKEKLLSSNMQNSAYGRYLMNKLDNILYTNPEERVVRGGEYTKSALAYKQAMESTIFGLDKDASWGQILRALPKNDRDFFIEFGKEKDPKKQKEILKHVSPYKRNILKNMWGMKTDSLESNESYFKDHELPNMFWEGWRPQKDLDDYEIKTIQNEGLLLSDFGYYESELDKPSVQQTGVINPDQASGPLGVRANLLTALNGIGLMGVEVSVTQVEKPGLSIFANIGKITDYKIKEGINNALGRTYYY